MLTSFLKFLYGIAWTALILSGQSFADLAHLDLLNVPSGTYIPLFPSETSKISESKKIDRIPVNGFKVQKFLITNESYLEFVKKESQWQRSNINPIFANEVYLQHWDSDLSFNKDIGKSPVVFVSWFAADAYCRSLDMRLPTTDEWEYLASLPITRDGKTLSPEEKNRVILDWYSLPSEGKVPEVVGSKKNALGIYDLFGLVWEWTYDFNSALMSSDNRSNSDKKNGLFCGGGAVGSNSPEDYAAFMRYAYRSSLKGNYSGINLGFRCVL